MKSRRGEFRAVRYAVVMKLTAFRGWQWLHDLQGRPNGLRSPRGTNFEYRGGNGLFCAVRPAVDFRLTDE